MNKNFVITIGRQYGSGGSEIGQKLASLFEIAYYDKELINEASKESGLSREYFEKADEKAPRSLMHALSMSWLMTGGMLGNDGSLCDENIFKFQSDVIQNLAAQRSCVIVGRCADYILRNNPHCYNLFIHAPFENRVARIIENEHITKKEAEELTDKKNKSRSSYYNFYTNKGWGEAPSYDLSIDSSILGTTETALFIKEFIEKMIAKNQK